MLEFCLVRDFFLIMYVNEPTPPSSSFPSSPSPTLKMWTRSTDWKVQLCESQINQQPRTTMVEKYLKVSLTCKEFQKTTLSLHNLEIGMYFFPKCQLLQLSQHWSWEEKHFFFQICLKFFLHFKQCFACFFE